MPTLLQPRLYWRAMRRMERRYAPIRAAYPELGDAVTLTAEYQLFREAVALVNRMATLQLAVA